MWLVSGETSLASLDMEGWGVGEIIAAQCNWYQLVHLVVNVEAEIVD